MYSWPEHYPDLCPPNDAEEAQGVVYRFLESDKPVEYDFRSHYERNPDRKFGNACMARGLSVLISLDDCKVMQVAIPAMRKKLLASGELTPGMGLMAKTPTETTKNHHTWWSSIAPSLLATRFRVAIAGGDVENV